jgi:hypothetical protein
MAVLAGFAIGLAAFIVYTAVRVGASVWLLGLAAVPLGFGAMRLALLPSQPTLAEASHGAAHADGAIGYDVRSRCACVAYVAARVLRLLRGRDLRTWASVRTVRSPFPHLRPWQRKRK